MRARKKIQTLEEVSIAQIINLIGYFMNSCDFYKDKKILLDSAYHAKAIVITSEYGNVPKIATIYTGDFNGYNYEEIIQEVFRVIDDFICK